MGFRLIRFVNPLILAVLVVLTLSGVYGLFWPFPAWMFEAHRLAGWLLVAAIPWKVAISWKSLRRGIRPDFERGVMTGVSLLLATLTLAILVLGLAWGFRLGPGQYWLRQTALSWHWMLALAGLLPLALHAWRRWPRPRQADFLSRRAALKLIGLGAAGLGMWWAAGLLGEGRARSGSPVRFTGSRLEGAFSGNRFPVIHTVAASQEQVDSSNWQLALGGALAAPRQFTYEQLLARKPSELIAALDCTLGWYTVQAWQGLPLADLLEEAGISPRAIAVRFESVTGYAQILPMTEACQILLATHVGGEPLDLSHGFPLRAVVPSRRGWFWVKWLTKIEVLAL